MSADGCGPLEGLWYSALQLAGLPGMPGRKRAVQIKADKAAWPYRARSGRGGGREYPLDCLPLETQAALLMKSPQPVASSSATGLRSPSSSVLNGADGAFYSRAYTAEQLASVSELYDRASDAARAEARRKTIACEAVAHLLRGGSPILTALEGVSKAHETALPTLKNWWYKVRNTPRDEWPLRLMDRYTGRTAEAACDERAWQFYAEHYLQRRAPSHADSYRRLKLVAAQQGWVIPSAKTLERRMEERVNPRSQILARQGHEGLRQSFPYLDRDKTVFAAGEAVNGDGLKFDKLWVVFEDGEIINTATAWVWQDLYSGRILAWRAGKTENTEIFRLSTWDLTALVNPKYCWLDNTVVAANKVMTGHTPGRHRFKDQADDFPGALRQLGWDVHFTSPSEETGNPGAKPIERAFGIGGLHDEVALDPAFSNRGYSKATAVTFAEFCEVLTRSVASFNARTGRRSPICAGRSYDQTWTEGLARTVPRRASEAQRRLLLLTPEVCTVNRRNGDIRVKAGRSGIGQNRYYCDALLAYAGQKVVAYLDPDNLRADAAIYTLAGEYLFHAQHQTSTAHNDSRSGGEQTKIKHRLIKIAKDGLEQQKRYDDLNRAALYAGAAPVAPTVSPPSVERAPFGLKVPDPVKDRARAERDAEQVAEKTATQHMTDVFMRRFLPPKPVEATADE